MSTRALSFVGAAVAAAVLLIPAAPAAADGEPHKTLRDFYRTGKYLLYIDGKKQRDARLYHSRRAGGFLVLDSSYGAPLLFLPRESAVKTFPRKSVIETTKGGLAVVAGTAVKSLGKIRIQGRDVTVRAEGLIARLRPRAWLIGPQKAEDLLLHTPEYARDGRRYKPRAGELKKLVSAERPTTVTVYFGSWCPTCRRLLPRILKVEKALEGSKVTFVYYGLPKGAAMRRDSQARKDRIKFIPTGVVLINGRVAGRINSKGWTRPEAALCNLVLRRV